VTRTPPRLSSCRASLGAVQLVGRSPARGEKWPGWKNAKATLQESKQHDPELHHVYGKLLAEVYFRLDKAMKAFYRRCKERKEGEKPGFPRFKPRHEFFTLCYPAMYLKVEGDKLTLPTAGKGERPNASDYRSHAHRDPTTDLP